MVRQQRRGLTERWVDQLVRPFETWSHAELAIPPDDHYRPMIAALGLLSPGEDPTFCNEAVDLDRWACGRSSPSEWRSLRS